MIDMANWACGTLKVRGTYSELKNFLENGIEDTKVIEHDNQIYGRWAEAILRNSWCHLKGVYRGFVVDAGDSYIENDVKEKQIVLLECNFAWGIDVDGLLKLAKEFHVDMKIKTFERGMEFEQDLEIVDGIITVDEETHYDDYQWECPCPTIGG